MKTFRYRKDLSSYHFEIRHKFVKGFTRLYQQERVKIQAISNVPEAMGFPQWNRPAPGQYSYAGLSDRQADVVTITNNDFRNICNYIYTPKIIVVQILFEFSSLVISSAEGDAIHHRFPLAGRQCLSIEKKLFKHLFKNG